jgi:hypothetical protein
MKKPRRSPWHESTSPRKADAMSSRMYSMPKILKQDSHFLSLKC